MCAISINVWLASRVSLAAATRATILLISRVYDPATPHSAAVATSQTLANAREEDGEARRPVIDEARA
jgi:hypothetical protein